jgi:hypothetical protein
MSQVPDQTLLELSAEELYARVGEVLIPGAGALPDRVQRASRAGRVWMDARSAELRSLVCPKLDVLLDGVYNDDLTLASAIADLIAGATGQVPAFTVSILMVRTGLRTFCGS